MSIVIGALLLGVAVGAFLLQRLYGGATPAWAFFLWGLLVLLLAQVANVSAIVLIQILNSRSSFSFLPLRDYALFVESVSPVGGAGGTVSLKLERLAIVDRWLGPPMCALCTAIRRVGTLFRAKAHSLPWSASCF